MGLDSRLLTFLPFLLQPLDALFCVPCLVLCTMLTTTHIYTTAQLTTLECKLCNSMMSSTPWPPSHPQPRGWGRLHMNRCCPMQLSTSAHDTANSRPVPAPSGCPPPSPGSSWSCQPARAHHSALRRGRGWCRRAPAPLRSPLRLQVDCQTAADLGTRVLNGAMRRQGNTRPCCPAPEHHIAGTVQKQAPEKTARACGGGQVCLARLGPVGDAGGAAAAPLCTKWGEGQQLVQALGRCHVSGEHLSARVCSTHLWDSVSEGWAWKKVGRAGA